VELSLSDEQQEMLVSVLQDTLGEVREEVYKAEVTDFRELLRRKEAVIRELLTKLGSPAASGG